MHTQVMLAGSNGAVRRLELPAPDVEILPGAPWGRFDVTMTPAFWAGRVFIATLAGDAANYRLGGSLAEEVVACLLGGHGIPAEVGIAAYERLRREGWIERTPTAQELEERLREPLSMGGRVVRYRFARQRAIYVSSALAMLPSFQALAEARKLRSALMSIPGVGPKTASWIVRNHLGADDVAIIDIHIWRACVAAMVFPPDSNPARDYFDLEDRFVNFAAALDCRTSALDNVMWREARQLRAA